MVHTFLCSLLVLLCCLLLPGRIKLNSHDIVIQFYMIKMKPICKSNKCVAESRIKLLTLINLKTEASTTIIFMCKHTCMNQLSLQLFLHFVNKLSWKLSFAIWITYPLLLQPSTLTQPIVSGVRTVVYSF